MTERIQLHYIELAANSCAPAWGTQMGPPISNLTDGRYDLVYVPEHQVVLATLKVNTSTAPVQTVAYPCSNVRSMCFSTKTEEKPASVPPISKRHKVKVEEEEVLPAYMREMK